MEEVKVNVPKFGEILTAMPKGMKFSEYRHKLAMQNAKLKARRQFGFLCYKAIEILETEVDGHKIQSVKKYVLVWVSVSSLITCKLWQD